MTDKKTEDDIEKSLQPLNFHDGCHDCGKRTDGLMRCVYPDGDEIQLCPTCMKHSGFCLMCGNFCAGISSFDFSEMPGYCSDCVEEIKNDFGEFDDDEEYGENEFGYREFDNDEESEDNNLNDSRNL
jgi:hypothetical protein